MFCAEDLLEIAFYYYKKRFFLDAYFWMNIISLDIYNSVKLFIKCRDFLFSGGD